LQIRKPTGVRLERKKEASLLNWNLKRPLPPEKISIPLSLASLPCVRAGDAVQAGQMIAKPEGPKGVSVHAGIAGVVEKTGILENGRNREISAIGIRRQGEPKTVPAPDPRKGWEGIDSEELLKIFRNSGLVMTNPGEEPVHVKIQRHVSARSVIINGCEPEPYLTCEQVLIMSHPVEVLRGAEILRKACGAARIVFAFEDTNLETIELIKSKIYFLKWEQAEVRTVPAIYPQGLESTLLQAWSRGKEDEAVVFPASTAFAAYEAVALQKPFYERVVTVGGECVVEPRSLWLPLGVSFQDAIRACKGVMREPEKVLMGGPMAGAEKKTGESFVTAGTSAILALPKEVVKKGKEEPCIRCGLCVDHCPVSLSPATITLAAEQKEFGIAGAWDAADCIECGNCAYICPSNRPMLELIHLAKGHMRQVAAHG